MSGSDPPPPVAGDDVWAENALLIRQLYISERKTLKQVKEVLESQHRFPIFPLSTYETKLRDKLRLRKKLKKADWPAVYQHVRDRGEKETGIYINGTKIPWKKAWKEIRRSGYRSASSSQLCRLPAGVIVRTPSPTIRPPLLSPSPPSPMSSLHVPMPIGAQLEHASFTLQSSIPATVPTHSNIPNLSTTQYIGGTHALSTTTTLASDFDVSYHRVFLESIPINTFRKTMHSIVSNSIKAPHNSGVVSGQQSEVNILGDIMHVVLGLNCGKSSPMSSFQRLGYSSSAPALNFDSYHFLARALYLLSNKIIDWNSPSNIELFDILFTYLQNRVLFQFLRSDLPTARAAWEASVPFAWVSHREDALYFLLKIGLERPDWLLPHGHMYLSVAASAGFLDIIRDLLRIGIRADDTIKYNSGIMRFSFAIFSSAILEAVQAKSMASVEALIQRCDVNRIIDHEFYSRKWSKRGLRSNFDLFFSAMGNKGRPAHKFHEISPGLYAPFPYNMRLSLDNEMHSQVLDMFLDYGADVDSRRKGGWGNATPLSELYAQNAVLSKWKPSLLDQSYYWNIKLYERLRPYSLKEAKQITRPGICLSAKRGKESLQAYLDSRPPQHPADRARLLELILAEQFFMEDWNIDAQVIQGLVDFGVDIKLPTITTTPTSLCRQLVLTATKLGFTDDISSLLRLLISQGAAIDDLVVDAAVTETGLGVLPELVNYGADIQNCGVYALCSAACFNNFEAVSWLLQAGVDINASIYTPHGARMIVAYICSPQIYAPRRYDQTGIEMLAYLIHRGAKLRLSPDDSGSFDFLKSIIGQSLGIYISERMELFLDSVSCPEDLATDQESLLASWNPCYDRITDGEIHNPSLAVYELLLRRGCPVRRKCQLASFIYYGGRKEVVYELLDAGADVNASSKERPLCIKPKNIYIEKYPIQAAAWRGNEELLDELVKRGANINEPAVGYSGQTALQGACACAWAVGDHARIDLVKTLIAQGADVNAPAAKYRGMTALQIAASEGDIGTALVLLEHGANINAPPAKQAGLCALDAAACNGRLDMVKLLLSMAAHSHDRGTTGYAGAIRLAVGRGHIAVAELIREHIKTFGNCIIVDLQDGNMVDAPDDSSQSSDDDDASDDSESYDSESD